MQTRVKLRQPRRPAQGAAPLVVEHRFWAVASLLLAFFAILAWLARPGGVTTGQDDAIYVILARSLQRFGYHDLYLVGTPLHHMYPPGYPALLAVLGSVVGERIALMQAFGVAAATAALGLFAAAVRQLWSGQVALVCLAVLVVNPHLVGTGAKIGSDATYLLFSMLALWLLAQRTPTTRMLAVAGAAAIAAALTRSVGVTLLAALGAHWLLERRYVASFGFAAVSAATVGAWLLWTFVAPEQYVGRSYVADATAGTERYSLAFLLFGRALRNFYHYFALFIPNRVGVPPLPGPQLIDLLAAATVAVLLLAGLWAVWQRWRAAALYVLAFGTLLIVWTWSLGRFLNVIIPLLVLAVLLGSRALVERLRPGWGFPALAVVAIGLVLVGSVRSARMVEKRSACEWGAQIPPAECREAGSRHIGMIGPAQAAFFNALEYVDHHTPPDAVILSAKPAPLYYFTGRQSLPLGRAASQGPDTFLEFLREEQVSYVILSRLHPGGDYYQIAPLLEANCAGVKLEASFAPHTHIFAVPRSAGEAGDGAACRAIAEYRQAPLRRSDD